MNSLTFGGETVFIFHVFPIWWVGSFALTENEFIYQLDGNFIRVLGINEFVMNIQNTFVFPIFWKAVEGKIY